MTAATPASKIKLLLVPVLLGILAWVLWTNVLSKGNKIETLELTTVARSVDTSTEAWPFNQFETAIANNPFQAIGPFALLPESNSTVVSETTAAGNPTSPDSAPPSEAIPAVEELNSESMTLLIKKGNRAVAVFGEQVIETGQTLRDGQKVESINPDGVVSTSSPSSPNPQKP
jgi:hypothetical protein